jgi:hypothetical protein
LVVPGSRTAGSAFSTRSPNPFDQARISAFYFGDEENPAGGAGAEQIRRNQLASHRQARKVREALRHRHDSNWLNLLLEQANARYRAMGSPDGSIVPAPIVCIGIPVFPSVGSPTWSLIEWISRHFLVVLVNEHNTSKVCL